MDLIEIPRVDSVRFSKHSFNENQFVDASICLTSHHLILIPKSSDAAAASNVKEIWLLHSLIDSLEARIRDLTKFVLTIKCKNFQQIFIEFTSQSTCQSIFKSLDGLSNLTCENLYPFFYKLDFKSATDGWSLPSLDSHFKAMFGVDPNDAKAMETVDWKISNINQKYEVCSTYPSRLIISKTAEDTLVQRSSAFRAQGRFPVLSYFHKPTKSFLIRSGQPLLGNNKKRCKEDELLLNSSLPAGKKGYIYDLRDAKDLKGAVSKGGGYETDANYPLWKRVNRHLERPEALQSSLNKLVDACCGASSASQNGNGGNSNGANGGNGNGNTNESTMTVDKWLSKLDASSWLNNMRQALYLACCVSIELHQKDGCVLVHGWEGSDNSLIVTSLAQVILNPECRTLDGFINLVEVEWVQAGHPFLKRCAKSAYGSTVQRQEGPVFLLFLDCVRHLLENNTLSFEFNEDFLLLLFDHSYASQFGTFLGNNEMERESLRLKKKTYSLWSYIKTAEVQANCTNPVYEMNNQPVWPHLQPQSYTVWSALFLRFQRNDQPYKEAKSEVVKLVEAEKRALQRVAKLQNDLMELQKEIINRNLYSQKSSEESSVAS